MTIDLRSDNVSGVAPEILAAIATENEGTAPSYGADTVTARLQDVFSALLETPCHVQPVATGTAANALALSLLAPPFGAVYASEVAHVHDSECGAPEFFTGGVKIVPLPATHGRLQPEALHGALSDAGIGRTSRVQPAALSVTQATERGTVYALAELETLIGIAKEHGLRVHMDGARFANAVAVLDCAPAELTRRLGVDVLSFGGTKNGCLAAEAVVVLDPELARQLPFRARRGGQTFSKMRFVSAQLEAYLADGLWLRLAAHANTMATHLAEGLRGLPDVRLLHPVEINEVFLTMPRAMIDGLTKEGFGLYDRGGGEVRLVASFDTRVEQIDAFVEAAGRHQRRAAS